MTTVLLALFLLASPAEGTQASSSAAQAPPLPAPVYVAPAQLDLPRVLPPWPAADSLASEADVMTVLAVQARRTRAEERDAQADSVTIMPDFTKRLLGPAATPERLPKLFALMGALHQDMRGVNRAANEARGYRLRPVLFDRRIKPSLDMIGHGAASYPSARTSSGKVWAEVIALLLPGRAEAARAEAERIAWRRVVGGVHYPSDLGGSLHVARAVMTALQASPSFQADLQAVRAELAAAGIR